MDNIIQKMDNNLRIINYLGKNIKKSYTMHELSKLLNIPYATFYRTVTEMTDVLAIKRVGKSKVVKIDLKFPATKPFLEISSLQETNEFLKKNPIIKKITSEQTHLKDIIVLFGSYAKGNQTEKSDIDLLIINKDGRKSISFSKYELLYKKKINPIFISKKEFKLMLKDKGENVGKQALENHIILNNNIEFWECVLSAV